MCNDYPCGIRTQMAQGCCADVDNMMVHNDASHTCLPSCLPSMSVQVMRCVHEARQIANAPGAKVDSAQATEGDKQALRVKNWLPGSYSRCDSDTASFTTCVYSTQYVAVMRTGLLALVVLRGTCLFTKFARDW